MSGLYDVKKTEKLTVLGSHAVEKILSSKAAKKIEDDQLMLDVKSDAVLEFVSKSSEQGAKKGANKKNKTKDDAGSSVRQAEFSEDISFPKGVLNPLELLMEGERFKGCKNKN